MTLPDSSRIDPDTDRHGLTRRDLLAGATAWTIAGGGLWLPDRGTASELPRGDWGSIERLADGLWAVASTPLAHRDFKTVCNGGIVAGSERVLVIEAFAGSDGARWVAEAALELTGRWPTDVVVTHYHGDHTGGLTGFLRDGRQPALHGTRATLDRLTGGDDDQEANERRALLDAATIVAEGDDAVLDLGGRQAILHPRGGHTASDVVVELPDLELGFGGDLLWNRMIPNFVDARPIELSTTLRALRDRTARTWVPGHGALGEARLLELNIELTSILEERARRSFEAGATPAQAAKPPLPAPFDVWVAFSATYVERAISAWHRDLAAS